MKNIGSERKAWLSIHAKHEALQKVRQRAKLKTRRRLKAGVAESLAPQLIQVRRRKYLKTVKPPARLSLRDNYDEFVTFIENLRHITLTERRNCRIDFTAIEHVSPAATLMMVAEIDRWRRLARMKLRAYDVEKWNPEVRRMLQEQGIFEVLEVGNPPEPIEAVSPDQRRLIRFVAGDQSLGEAAAKMQLALLEAAGGGDIGLDDQAFYIGITEAMNNAVQHAYPTRWDYQFPIIPGRWWLSGSYSPATREMTVQLYDQGIGIPAHLPMSKRWNRVLSYLEKKIGKIPVIGEQRDDAAMIQAATETGETGTQAGGRGYGLGNIIEFIDKSPSGLLRILSGCGEYVYEPQKVPVLTNHSTSIGGTLIEWRVTLSS